MSDINDQMRQQAHAARIRAERQKQREAAQRGEMMTRAEARQSLRDDADRAMDELRRAQPGIAQADQMQAAVRDLVSQEMAKLQLTGPGVSGAGFSWSIDPPGPPEPDVPQPGGGGGGMGGWPEPAEPGEGVYTDSLGGGPVALIIDSGATLTDTVSVKSLNDGDGILLDDSSVAGQVKIEVALSTAADKSIALSFATGTVYAEWFYSNTSEGAGYINLLTEIDATDGATFRALKEEGGSAINFALDGDNIIGEFVATNVGSGVGVYKENDSTEGARFRSLKAADGSAVAVTLGAGGDHIEIGCPIAVASSDSSIGVSEAPAGTFDIIVQEAKYSVIETTGAEAGDVLVFNGTAWAPAGTPYWITVLAATTPGGTPTIRQLKVVAFDDLSPISAASQDLEVCDPDGTVTVPGLFTAAP